LGLENEEKLIGKGVGYCATCDGMFFRGKTVAVIGGGNSAAADALYLSKICSKVYLIHRRDKLRAERVYQTPLMAAENIEFIWNSTVSDILSDETVTGIKIKNTVDNTENEIALSGVFISIGREPQTELFNSFLETDENGYIIADESTRTSIDGVYAIGDVRTKYMRQIVTAAADGANAAHFAEEYLHA
jgi:thioredoxin reductase (NADPH)